jgi:hypothetical protein
MIGLTAGLIVPSSKANVRPLKLPGLVVLPAPAARPPQCLPRDRFVRIFQVQVRGLKG